MSTKAEKRRKKRMAAREAAAQIEAKRWIPREGKDRPTQQRLTKGAFVLRDTEDAGVSVAVDENATMLDRLRSAGLISEDQRQAGHDLAGVLQRTSLAPQGRSCLDMTPRGHHGDDTDETWQERRDSQQRRLVWARCKGPWVWPELMRVCRDDEACRHIDSLRSGLDICVQVFRE